MYISLILFITLTILLCISSSNRKLAHFPQTNVSYKNRLLQNFNQFLLGIQNRTLTIWNRTAFISHFRSFFSCSKNILKGIGNLKPHTCDWRFRYMDDSAVIIITIRFPIDIVQIFNFYPLMRIDRSYNFWYETFIFNSNYRFLLYVCLDGTAD